MEGWLSYMAPLKALFRSPLLIAIIIYLLLIIFVSPFGEFSINDDWVYRRQVEAFASGEYRINSQIDPSIILHVALGFLWTKLFGVSFLTLRLLTMTQTIFLFVGIYKVLGALLPFSSKLRTPYFLLLVLNPLLLISSFTFMTEISFLLFYVWSVYFYLIYLKDKKIEYLLLGTLFCGFSFLVRQVGLVLYVGVFISSLRTLRNYKHLFVSGLLLSVFVVTWAIWPRFAVTGTEGGLPDLLSKTLLTTNLLARLQALYFLPIYITYFFLPFGFFLKLPTKVLLIFRYLGSVFLAIPIFKYDIFPMGNVLYIEALYAKSNFQNNLSLFDNILFKYAISYLISFALIGLLINAFLVLKESGLKFKTLQPANLFLALLVMGNLFILILGNDLYDRYLLPLFFSIAFLAYFAVSSYQKLGSYILLSLTTLITAVLLQDFFAQTPIRWSQAIQINNIYGYKTQVSVDDVFTKYMYSVKLNDFSGLLGSKPGGLEYLCYVQRFTEDRPTSLFNSVDGVASFAERYVENPKIYGSRKIDSFPKIKKNLDKLIYVREYPSALYNLVGKKAYVGSWCADDRAGIYEF